MKIMILAPSFKGTSPVQGAFLLAKYLDDHAYNTVFAALDADDPDSTTVLGKIRRAGLPCHNFHMTGWTGLGHLGRVRRYVRDNGVDVVVSCGLRPDIVNSCLSGVVRLSAIREILRDQYALTYGRVVSRLAADVHLTTLKKLDGIFVLTREMRLHLVENGVDPSRIHLVNNFVDVTEVRRVLEDNEGKMDNDVHIGCFGRLIRRKRVDVALRGVRKLVYEFAHKNVKFHVVGDGPLRLELMRLAEELGLEEQSVFHGYVANPLDLMKRMDLVLLTSDREGMPRCLLEALSLGKTCIATDIPGMAELIRDGETGYLFRQGDVDGLAFLMDEIMSSGRYLSPEYLYRFMLAHYDVNTCGKEMLNRVLDVSSSKASLV